ncbi:MAG: hypothetical protein WAL90_15165 [Desulfobacterales bacterium]
MDTKNEPVSECSMNETDAQGHFNLCCCYVIDEEGEYEDPCFQPVEECGCCD